jgi:hypothetical protein
MWLPVWSTRYQEAWGWTPLQGAHLQAHQWFSGYLQSFPSRPGYLAVAYWGGWFGGSTPLPKFRNFDKEPKIKKILLYEMKFLVQNYSCLQNPWLGGPLPPDPHSLCPQLDLLNPPPPPNKIPRYATDIWIAITHNCHQNALLSGSGIAWLPNFFEPLCLPALRFAPGWLLALTGALWWPLILRRFRPRCTRSMCRRFFLWVSDVPCSCRVCDWLLWGGWGRLLSESLVGASASLAFLARFLAAPLQFF